MSEAKQNAELVPAVPSPALEVSRFGQVSHSFDQPILQFRPNVTDECTQSSLHTSNLLPFERRSVFCL